MKKVLLVFAATLFSVSMCFAQPPFAQGTWAVGGNLNFTSVGGDANGNTSFGIGPQVCYVVKENLFVGLQVSFASETEKDDYKISSFGANVMVEKFPEKLSGNIGGIYAGAGLGFSSGTVSDESGGGSPDQDFSSFGVLVDYGAWFNIAKNFKLKAALGGIGYTSNSYGDDYTESVISLNLNPLSSLDFTLKFLIPPSN